MTQKAEIGSIQFQNGKPHFEYDQIYPCFKDHGNGLLFRLVNTEAKQWAFYNDTADTIMKVRAVLEPGSEIRTVRRVIVNTIPHDDGSVDDKCKKEVMVDVNPGFTEPFLEGTVTGFSMSFQSEAAPVMDVQFVGRKPTVPYDKIYKCFKNNGNGLLFRLIDEHNQKWYFYNDTKDYVMKARVTFEDPSMVHREGKTKDAGAPKDGSTGTVYELEIMPGRTEPFITGNPINYRLSFSAEPSTNDRPVDPSEIAYENGEPNWSIVKPNSEIYPCFKEEGNGLLFRLVDEENEKWAFYNDTAGYVMKATVRIPDTEQYRPGPHTKVAEDPTESGVHVLTMDIPPLETMEFLTGLPGNFEVAFSADPVQ